MEYLGQRIKKLGFGLMRLPMIGNEVDIEHTKRMVDLFLENGFTYFDTAYGYIDGKSEAAAKTALVERHPRESFELATKLPAWAARSAEEAQGMLYTSLERTGSNYFDYYLLHNLGVGRTETFDNFGIWDFLRAKRDEGVIRHLGFSLHAKADYLDEVLTTHPDMEFVQLQINYADWEDEVIEARKCYEVALKHKKPVIIMEPVKGGALAKLPEKAAAVLKQANPDASLSEWALRYAASLEGIITVLSGMSSIDQMKENIALFKNLIPLTGDERAAIEKARRVLASIPQVPCTDCLYCVKGCPANIAIPGTFKAINDYSVFGDLERAKGKYYWETYSAAKASECTECGACETVCPQSIGIIGELKKAALVLES